MKYKRKNPEATILTYDEIKKYWEENGEPRKFVMEQIEIMVDGRGYFSVETGETDEMICYHECVIKENDEWPCVMDLYYMFNNFDPIEEEDL